MEQALTERIIKIEADYLHFPIKKDGVMNYVSFFSRGKILHEFHFALTDQKPDYYTFLYVGDIKGQNLTLTLPRPAGIDGKKALAAILQGGPCTVDNPLYPDLYREKLRPAFHFSPRRGWNNDPNGLIYADGKYHLYFQHNPFATEHGAVNVSWGHATSKGLIHWTEHDDAIMPENRFYNIASGTCAIDFNNTLGKGYGTILAAYTGLSSANFTGDVNDTRYKNIGQNLAYSTDGGYTFTPLPQNPVIHTDEDWRDPCLFWHEPSKKWIIVVFEVREGRYVFSFYSSENLIDWTFMSCVGDFYECPDFYRIKVENEFIYKWVLVAANGRFVVGTFDGERFFPETDITVSDLGTASYAGQNWLNSPDGRILNICWLCTDKKADAPFCQGMTVVTELKLVRVPDGYRLYRCPIEELTSLRKNSKKIKTSVKSGSPYEFTLTEPCEIQITLHKTKGRVHFTVGRQHFAYDGKEKTLYLTDCPLEEDKIRPLSMEKKSPLEIRCFFDTLSVELFYNGGEFSTTYRDLLEGASVKIDGDCEMTFEVWGMRSIWF